MTRFLTFGVAALALSAAPAFAEAPIFNWNGFYIGLNVGAANGIEKTNNSVFAPNCNPARPCGFAVAALSAPEEINVIDFIGGLQAGFNKQIGNFVGGIESDFDFLPLKGSFQFGPTTLPGGSGGAIQGNRIFATNWLATIRARGGVAMENKLIYVTGGVAFTEQRDPAFYSLTNPSDIAKFAFSTSNTRAGWVAGAGLEEALAGGWSMRAEFLHIDFEPVHATALVIGGGPSFGGSSMASSSHLRENIFRAGLNYRFSSSSAFPADMPVKAPPTASTFDWTGWYSGVNGGYVGSKSPLIDVANWWNINDGHAGVLNPDNRISTATFGGQIGYNFQFAPKWIIGFETDINYRDALKAWSLDTGNDLHTFSSHVGYFGTVRARLGYAYDRVLVYVTGGYAYGKFEHELTDFDPGEPLFRVWYQNLIKSGWTIGGGGEYAIASNWTIKAEALYINFGSKTTTSNLYEGPFVGRVKDDAFVARMGLNYKFGGDPWGKSPVVAKY
jgi:outer membrane immunogenic protein